MSRLYTLSLQIGNRINGWSEEQKLFSWSLLYLIALYFVPNNKILLPSSLLFVGGIYFICKSFIRALLYGYIFLLPFQNGKGFDFLVVPVDFIREDVPFIVTPTFSMSLVMSSFLIYLYIRNRIFHVINPVALHVGLSDVLLIIFLTTGILSSIISNIPLLSFLLTLQLWNYIFIYYYIHQFRLNGWVSGVFLPIISSLVIFEGAWSLLQFMNKGPLGKWTENIIDPSVTHVASENTSLIRLQGTFSHPNFLGYFMAVMAPILLYYSLSKYTSMFGKIVSAVGFLAGVTGLVLSGSRASWVCFGVATIVLLRISVLRSSILIQPLIRRIYRTAAILCVMILPIVIIPRLMQLNVTFGQGGGAQFRLDLISKALIITSQNPFGIGLGTFPQVLMEEMKGYTSAPTQPHNLIAQILVAFGFIGVVSFLGFIYLKLKEATRVIQNSSGKPKALRLVYAFSLGIFFMLSMFYPILTEQQIFAWLWIFLSVVV